MLLRAHELRSVHDESPLVTAVLHRILIACVHRVVDGPTSRKPWKAIWDQPRFDERAVRAYFDRWRPRFDLFHPERPFFQVAGLFDQLSQGGKEPSTIPMRRLPMERSTYAGTVWLLEHGGEDTLATPAEAARALLSVLGFGAGGRISNTADSAQACPLRAGSVVLAKGETLRDSLALNLIILGSDRPVPRSVDDKPTWERDRPTGYGSRPFGGWLDALTWQSRRIELRREGPLVKAAVISGGEKPRAEWDEPMFAMDVKDPKKGPLAVKFMPDRATFRDAVALFQSVAPLEGGRRPAVCSQLADLISEEILPVDQPLDLELLGMSCDQAKIRLTRSERVPLPASLLIDTERLAVLRGAIERAEELHSALSCAEFLLAKAALSMGDRDPHTKDVSALKGRLQASSRYWAALAAEFPAALREVGTGVRAETGAARFGEAAKRAAKLALDRSADQLGDGARAHRARAIAETYLLRELSKLFPVPETQRQGAQA